MSNAEIEFEFCRLAARLEEMKKYAPKAEGTADYLRYIELVRKDLVSYLSQDCRNTLLIVRSGSCVSARSSK